MFYEEIVTFYFFFPFNLFCPHSSNLSNYADLFSLLTTSHYIHVYFVMAKYKANIRYNIKVFIEKS
ncbi:hypothetical protein CM19_04610 [Candidatus Acidianus copahuensis]|uniref:Uncharacterized protein n=1 Tax=Candidatus Acidianus copahuensis TaxID=1160895 RepID=A0A031LNV0_9CREN|nr:hypothetical protein CM19_04610 [Candidatus Acidianus copahuensis]